MKLMKRELWVFDFALVRSYEAFRALRESDAWGGMPEARRRAVEAELRDFCARRRRTGGALHKPAGLNMKVSLH